MLHLAPPTYPLTPAARFASTIVVWDKAATDASPAGSLAALGGRVGLIGLADDMGVGMNGGRLGAALGPKAFREALSKYGVAEPFGSEGGSDQGTSPTAVRLPKVIDLGDVIPGKSLDETLDRITAITQVAYDAGLIPVGIGGGHDLTYPFVRAGVGAAGIEAGVYVDPHLDVRPTPGSGMPFRFLVERCGLRRLTNIGAEPLVNSAEHALWLRSNGGTIYSSDDLRAGHSDGSRKPLPEIFARALAANTGRGQFVSLDLDCIDASFAPGVSALNPDGFTPGDLGRVAFLAGASADVRCFDLMELCPEHDQQGRTARIAAYLFLRFLQGLGTRQLRPDNEQLSGRERTGGRI